MEDLVLSASNLAILADLKSFFSSDSSNLVPKPLCMMSKWPQEGHLVGTLL